MADIDGGGIVEGVLDRFGITAESRLGRLIGNVTSDFEEKIEEIGEDLIDTAASRIGIRDVYVAHIMTYCEGLITGDENDNHTTITNCTDPEIPFSFDPIEILQSQLRTDLTLERLGVPTDTVEDVIRTLQTAYKAMSVLYVIGIALAGLAILLGLVGLTGSRLVECCNSLIAWVSFLCLGVASAIATAIAIKGRDVFNENARDAGVYATESKPFLGMTWGSVVAMFLAALCWSFFCCFARHSKKSRSSRDEPLVEKQRTRRARPSRFGGLFGRRRRAPVV